jgi:hypothetical protein
MKEMATIHGMEPTLKETHCPVATTFTTLMPLTFDSAPLKREAPFTFGAKHRIIFA